MRHQITLENYEDAEAALRDILFMYWEAIGDGSLTGCASVGSFDPFQYLDATVSPEIYPFDEMLRLLHEGSAVAILRRISDRREEDTEALTLDRFCGFNGHQVYAALIEGRFDHLPLAKAAVLTGFSPTYSKPSVEPRDFSLFIYDQETNFWPRLREVYDSYVVCHYQRLLQTTD